MKEKSPCTVCGVGVEWPVKARPDMCLCEECFIVKIKEVCPGIRVEGDRIIGLRLRDH
jgi:hypothetical protein